MNYLNSHLDPCTEEPRVPFEQDSLEALSDGLDSINEDCQLEVMGFIISCFINAVGAKVGCIINMMQTIKVS